MKIAIHPSKGSFSDRWITYCQEQSIEYKLVNCYQSDIVQQLHDCDALMWHFHQEKFEDQLFSKQLLTSLQFSGKYTFPDFNSFWHFDDKVAQKYLMESLELPLVKSYVFYNKIAALEWVNKTTFPLVFKLRGGAGSYNVKLIRNFKHAKKIIDQAFGRGFPAFDRWSYFNERLRKSRAGLDSWLGALKGFGRLFIVTDFGKKAPNEREYVYFQEFIPGNNSDTRIIVLGQKAFAIKRMVRENDFRASGSGNIRYKKEEFDERCVSIAFNSSEKLKASCMTYDFVFDKENQPKIVEISYGFKMPVYDKCSGYWDRNLNWYDGPFIPQNWMVDHVLWSIGLQKKNKE